MSGAPASAAGAGAAATDRPRWRLRRPGRRLLPVLALLLVAAGAVVAVTSPFSDAGDPSGAVDEGTATALATVARQSLSSQTQVTGTLGYAGSSSIVVPAGTTPADVRTAQQAVEASEAELHAAQATLATDSRALAEAQAKLAADRRKLASDCAGAGAAGSPTGGGPDDGGSGGSEDGSGSTPCATAAQAVTSDEQAVMAAQQKVTADDGPVASARVSLAAARQALAAAQASATAYDTGAAFTTLPSPGDVVRRGQPLYAIADQPTLLLYGQVAAWRAFRAGMSPGRDVAQLNANLRALGYGSGLAGDHFTAATGRAITALQAAHRLPQTGVLALGLAAFKRGPVRVTSVQPEPGAAVEPGPVLEVSSTRHRVTIALDAGRQSEVKEGDEVTITLPDMRTTPGVVSSVGNVATAGGEGSPSTIPVNVRLADRATAGRLDQAPVQVVITTATVDDALVVPVAALLAPAGRGYAVEVVDAAGVPRLVPVRLGLFDDAGGLVEVTGSGLRAGQRIVVPTA